MTRSRLPPPSNIDLPEDMDDTPEVTPPPRTNRKAQELEAALASRMTGKPLFPYPPELDPRYRPYWLELVNSYPVGYFELSDIPLIRMYCQKAYDIERLTKLIEEHGEVTLTSRGYAIHPYVKARSVAEATFMTITTKLRNQPASRVSSDFDKKTRARGASARRGAGQVDESDGLLAGNRVQH